MRAKNRLPVDDNKWLIDAGLRPKFYDYSYLCYGKTINIRGTHNTGAGFPMEAYNGRKRSQDRQKIARGNVLS